MSILWFCNGLDEMVHPCVADSSFGTLLSVLGSIGRITVKELPLPLVEVNWIWPPKSEVSSWVMDNPKPVPSMPWALFSRVKAWNMRWLSSVVMPFPVSQTFNMSSGDC